MAVTDVEEWLHPDAASDEVVLEVDEVVTGLVLAVRLVVTPAGRSVHLDLTLEGVRARHDAEAAGPPTTNWDRMTLGGVEWRMVEPLHCWDLAVDVPDAGLRAYLSFTGTSPPTRIEGGYAQLGTVSGQVQLADRRITVTTTPARRTHSWR